MECQNRLAKAGDSLRKTEARLRSHGELFEALQQEARGVRLLPGFPTIEVPEGERSSAGAGLIPTFRELRRLAMMEVQGEESGSLTLLQASKAAEDPATSAVAYGGIVCLVCFTACCLGRWKAMQKLFQMQVALLNSAWAGIWLCLGLLATFVGRNPIALVHKDVFHGFSLLVMALYIYAATCNIFALAFLKGAVQKASALLSVVVGAVLYYWLYELGKEERHMGARDDNQDFLSAHSYVIFFAFSGIFAMLAMGALSTVAAQIQHQAEPPKPESKLKKFKGARKGPAKDASEVEMFVIGKEDEEMD